jgi:predicted HTH domain antitoxin
VSVTIPDELLAAAGLNEDEIKQELALALFQRDRITLAQAGRLAGMNQLQFQTLLAQREIPVHYGVPDFERDLDTLHRLGRA